MTRIMALAALCLALAAGRASANWPNPGYVKVNGGLSFSFGHAKGVQPYQLGPWYQYFPYEAHFQHPAMPQYPYWGSQSLPGGLPYISPGRPGHGPVPAYWGN